MDISKIIDNSLDETIKGFLHTDNNSNLPTIDNEKLEALAKQDKILITYSGILLENYHKELSKLLANCGIQI